MTHMRYQFRESERKASAWVSFWVFNPAYACSLGVVHAMIRKPLIPY